MRLPQVAALVCAIALDYVLSETCDQVSASIRWDNKLRLNREGTYRIKWKMSDDAKSITIQATARGDTPTWMGFGFSEVGHMLGSDVYTVRHYTEGENDDDVVDTPALEFLDQHVPWQSMNGTVMYPPRLHPVPDEYQSAEIVCSTKSNGRLMFIFTRLLDTGDLQDRVIKPGNNPVVYAIGINQPEAHYHFDQRGSVGVTFFGPTPPSDPIDAEDSIEIAFTGGFATSEETRTQYICQAFDIGTDLRHIIAANAIIAGDSSLLAHHLIVHACGHSEGALYNLHKNGPSVCQAPNDPNAHGNSPLGHPECPTLLYGWNRGGTKMTLPEAAGLPVGGSEYSRYIILEVHIDNPLRLKLSVESLGAKMLTTSVLRRFNAASMSTGDYDVSMGSSTRQPQQIAANMSEAKYETTCSAACTSTFSGPINIFSTLLHMHMNGKTIYLTKKANDSVEIVDYRQFWNPGYQALEPNLFTLTPGEQLNLHCSYDTLFYDSPVIFGRDATNEMCVAYLFYYPARYAVPFCGFYHDQSTCGGYAELVNPPEENPIPDGTSSLPYSMTFGNVPVNYPTVAPSAPSVFPTAAPYHDLTYKPSRTPRTRRPTGPTLEPVSVEPTVNPSADPSFAPTLSYAPTTRPRKSKRPTSPPTEIPSMKPRTRRPRG